MKDKVEFNLNYKSSEKTSDYQSNQCASTAEVLHRCDAGIIWGALHILMPGSHLPTVQSLPPPRASDLIDMRCSLGVGSSESSLGYSNKHQSWEPLLCKVAAEASGISYAPHATKWI